MIQEERGRYLTQPACQDIVQRVLALTKGGYTAISISSWLNGELRWARNRVNLSSDRCNIQIRISRGSDIGWGLGSVLTNQIDDASLEGAVRYAERECGRHIKLNMWTNRYTGGLKSPELSTPVTAIWSDSTAAMTNSDRSRIVQMLTEDTEAKGMLSAGYLEARCGSAASWANFNPLNNTLVIAPELSYRQLTQAQCSMTVRHPRGTGSGWAGASSFNVAKVEGAELARRALEKCLASIDPVRIEPGRYTVILEPQALNGLIGPLMDGDNVNGPLSRVSGENKNRIPGPFFLAYDDALRVFRSKLGLKIVDERITISHDPVDPVLGVVPMPGLQPITWIRNGVLTSLHHPHDYAMDELQRFAGELYRPAFRVSGGDTTINDMIATTKRGLLVTRFSGIEGLDEGSLLLTGTTRDGLWLIENGAITKAVWNMRFTESPLFALNQVEQLGVPQPVFRPVKDPGEFALTPAVVPAMKINDFSFTSLVDAV